MPGNRFQLDFRDFDYMHVTRYGVRIPRAASSLAVGSRTSVKGVPVLVVDDILDEGITLAAVKDSLRRLGAAEVMAAVFDKQNGLDKARSCRFCRAAGPQSLCIRLQHGRSRCLAASSGDLRGPGGMKP